MKKTKKRLHRARQRESAGHQQGSLASFDLPGSRVVRIKVSTKVTVRDGLLAYRSHRDKCERLEDVNR